ncbi:MAG: hypothetical protein HC924_06605 [Synechococcaceae cyanobacterium SM2_3_2]|nr:hypothetical protein [Synechococcaceae cyanobacterium SM2_3_2]
MTEEERFNKLADAIERVADASTAGIQMLTQAQLATQQQMGLMATEIIRLGQRVDQVVTQQAAMQERQAEQDQRFDVLLGEIRHIVQRLDEGSNLG